MKTSSRGAARTGDDDETPRAPTHIGWLRLIKAGDVRRDQLPAVNRTPADCDLWETPTGETYWLRPGARLEGKHNYTVL